MQVDIPIPLTCGLEYDIETSMYHGVVRCFDYEVFRLAPEDDGYTNHGEWLIQDTEKLFAERLRGRLA